MIGILAVLSTVAVVTLSPLELIKQARDSTRMADLATLNKAVAVYQSSGQTNLGTVNTIYVSIPSNQPNCSDLGLPTPPYGWTYVCVTSSTLRKTDGTGWIPLNFSAVSYGTPLEKLPVDPINATSTYNYYEYIPGGSWKILAVLESDKYQSKARLDGGTASQAFEAGTDMSLGSPVFPSGWVKVPGNGSFGTSDFWVMKYDAKCVQGSNNTPLISPEATPYHTYYDSSAPCTSANGKYIASTPDGY
ncbi:MAG: hypothetical protein NTW60_00685, partial [Candidatus Wolfebacteria bacterium]|nr:hypothetical protein [Candidatus Wolfebacteria bacterium]